MSILVSVTGILGPWEWCLGCAGGAGMDPSGILCLGGIRCQVGEGKQGREAGEKWWEEGDGNMNNCTVDQIMDLLHGNTEFRSS